MHAVTIVARNYLPMARVLAASFLAQHPTGRFSVLVIDGSEIDRAAGDGFDVLLPEELGLPRAEWRAMAAMYTVTEFATSMKPATLRHVLSTAPRGTGVAYIDPDVLVLAPFPEVFAAAVANDIALTPHVLRPLPRDGRSPDEEVIRHAGIFNLGFLCVSHEAAPFLDWWHERLVTDAVVDLPRALFTDQRWIDFVPGLFRHAVLRDPGLNVAYWNAHERPLAFAADGTITAGDSPLRFFHFSGFDPRIPWRLSKHAGPAPRVLLGDNAPLRELCDRYARLLDANGFGLRADSYGLDRAAGGQLLTLHVRTAYRQAVAEARLGRGSWPPDPFDPGCTAAFADWVAEEVAGPPGNGFNRWELALYDERVDLHFAFPDHHSTSAAYFRRWLDTDPYPVEIRRSINNPLGAVRISARALPAAERPIGGINVAGYLAGELGVGEAARRIAAAVDLTGLPSHPVGVRAAGARHDQRMSRAPQSHLRFRDTIYCINADETVRVVDALEHHDRAQGDARRYGLWFWELAEFPSCWPRAFDLLDEVWVTSEFTRAAVAARSSIPVRLVPLPVIAPSRPSPFTRTDLGLPDAYVFATSVDFNSVGRRKNPLDTVAAFTAAFGPDDGAHLSIKSINGMSHLGQFEQLRWAMGGRTDISLVDAHWSAHRVQGWLEACDCFISLHRSEGFGLNLAAAMAAARPVIATGYSGNMDFMTPDTSRLVPFELVEVGADAEPYNPSSYWAQPDVAAAAQHMRAVFDHQDDAVALGRAALVQVLSTHSAEHSARIVRSVLLPEADHRDEATSSMR